MFITENTLWNDNDSKTKFLASPTKIGNAFWINILGFCALYDRDKDFSLLHTYLNQKVQLQGITEDSSDLMLIIKILHDKNLLNVAVAKEITKLLALMKTRKIDKIDQALLRKLLKKIPVSKVKVSTLIKPYIVDFIKGNTTLEDLVDPLYTFSLKQKSNEEFRMMARRMKNSIDTSTLVAVPSPVKAVKTKPDTTTASSLSNNKDVIKNALTKIGPEFPFYKNNKDLAKLFVLKIINLQAIYKKPITISNVNAHLRKFNATVQDIKNIVSEDDLKNMIESGFPHTHPELKVFTSHSLFKPVTNNDLASYKIIENFYDIFKYRYILKRFLQKKFVMTSNRYIEVLETFTLEDLQEIKDELLRYTLILLFPANIINGVRVIIGKKNSDFIKSLLYSIKEFPFKELNGIFLEKALAEKDVYEWLKDWYENTIASNKEFFKAIAFKGNIKVDFIKDNEFSEDEMLYVSFKKFLTNSKDNSPQFANGYEWLKSHGKIEQFKEDFENPMFDNIFVQFDTHRKQLFRSLEDFIINRKRPFIVDEYIFHSYKTGTIDAYVTHLFDKYFMEKIKDGSYKVHSYMVDTFLNHLNENNWLDFFGAFESAWALESSIFDCLSIYFIESNINKIMNIFNKESKIYEYIFDSKNWLAFDIDELKSVISTEPSTIMSFSRILLGKEQKNPKDRWKRCKEYFIDFVNQNNVVVSYVVDSIIHSPLSKERFNDLEDDIIQNFKDKITKDKITLKKAFYNISLFSKLFDNEEDFVEGISNIGASSPNKILEATEYIKNIKNIKTLFEKNSNVLEPVTSKSMPILLTVYNFNDLIERAMDELNENDFDDFLATVFQKKTKNTIVNNIRTQLLNEAVIIDIYDDNKSLIRPLQKLDKKRIKEILKYNNVTVALPPELRKTHGESDLVYLKRIKDNHKFLNIIEALKVDKIEETEEQLEQKTAEYTKYYNNKHGNVAIEFLESFNVDMPNDELEKWIKENPNPNVIPAFHGTGSIGASMILRYGFAVLKRTDASVVGRMLGDGIYISNIIEKTAQYIGDSGFSRGEGTIGYILEMEAYIGKKGVNHNSAGTDDDRDSIRSPEWVIFNPRAQLKIVKAHKVRITSKAYVNSLKLKYNINIKENSMRKSFKNYLMDNKMIKEEENTNNVISYIFYDGDMIDHYGNILPFEDFKEKYKSNPNIIVSNGQLGPVLDIKTTANVLGSFHIPCTYQLKSENPENLYDKYITILTNAIEGEYKE